MTWSYTGDPADNQRDEVRFLIGDTDFGDQLVQDEEINYALGAEPTPTAAAVRVARALASKLSRKVDKQVGDLKLSLSQQAKHFRELADFLEKSDSTAIPPIPYAGGISRSDKDSVRDNADRARPAFTRGRDDFPGVPYNDAVSDEDV
jgi:hypothetical protein